MFDEEKIYQALTDQLRALQNHIMALREESQSLEEVAPEAGEAALEKIEVAFEKFEEAREYQDECRQRLAEFLEQAAIAARMYDLAQNSTDPNAPRDAERARTQAEKIRAKVDRDLEKLSAKLEKVKIAVERATTRVNVAQIKAKTKEERDRNKKVRINFTLPEDMKDDWKDLSDELGISVSEMIRDAMSEFKQSIKSLDGLDKDLSKIGETFGKAGSNLGKFGHKISNYVQNELEKNLGPEEYMNFTKSAPKRPRAPITPEPPVAPFSYGDSGFTSSSYAAAPVQSGLPVEEKETIKKRITGIIKILHSLPIEKLAQALNKTPQDAENMIYELAAEGIEGKLEGGVFQYKGKDDDIIKSIHEMIDRM